MSDSALNDAQAGVVANQPVHDVQEVAAATTKQPDFRIVQLKVPADMPDHVVQQLWTLGIRVDQTLSQGHGLFMMLLAKPTGKEEKLRLEMLSRILVVNGEEDLVRVLRLIDTTTQVNVAAARAQQEGKIEAAATATVQGATLKHNLEADLTAQVKGQSGGIVIAS